MSTRAVAEGYMELVEAFPLRAIRDGDDYAAAAAMLNKLVLRDDLSEGEQDYLDALPYWSKPTTTSTTRSPRTVARH